MKSLWIFAAALAGAGFLAAPAAAQNVSSVSREGIKRIVVYGTDPCPPSPPGDIVICARRPDKDRYRLPERFRAPDKLTGEAEAWAYRAERLEVAGATGIGSCSPVGPGGIIGCEHQLIEQARAARRQDKKDAQQIP